MPGSCCDTFPTTAVSSHNRRQSTRPKVSLANISHQPQGEQTGPALALRVALAKLRNEAQQAKARERKARRRANKAARAKVKSSVPHSARKRKRLHKANDGRCHYCHIHTILDDPMDDHGATLDHLVPKARGGSDRNENLVLACRKCNHDKGRLLPEEFTPGDNTANERAKAAHRAENMARSEALRTPTKA